MGICPKSEHEYFPTLFFCCLCLFVCLFVAFAFWAFPIFSPLLMILFLFHPIYYRLTYIVLSGNYKSVFWFGMYFSPHLKHYTISIIIYLLPIFLYVVSQHRYVHIFHSFVSLTRNVNPYCPRLDVFCQVFISYTVTVKVVLFLLR